MAYLAKLGEFAFQLDTASFEKLQRQTSYRWEFKNRIGRKPAGQFVGMGEDGITLNGVIYPTFKGGIGQVEKLRTMAAEGKPLGLVYAFERVGQYAGLWCVTEISDTREFLFDDGTPRKIEFQVTLREYGEDAKQELAGGSALGALSSYTDGQSPLEAAAMSLPTLNPASALGSVVQVAEFVGDVARNAKQYAQDAVAAVAGAAAGALVASLPPAAQTAIVEVQQAASAVVQAHNEVVTAIEGVGSNLAGLQKTAIGLQQAMTAVAPGLATAGELLATAERSTRAVAQSAVDGIAAAWNERAGVVREIRNAASEFEQAVVDTARHAANAAAVINV